MTDIGIRTFLTFYGDAKSPEWPFKRVTKGEHTWEEHRLPAAPPVGTRMHFSKFPDDTKRNWEVFAVEWVYDENAHPIGEQDKWHLEVSLR